MPPIAASTCEPASPRAILRYISVTASVTTTNALGTVPVYSFLPTVGRSLAMPCPVRSYVLAAVESCGVPFRSSVLGLSGACRVATPAAFDVSLRSVIPSTGALPVGSSSSLLAVLVCPDWLAGSSTYTSMGASRARIEDSCDSLSCADHSVPLNTKRNW